MKWRCFMKSLFLFFVPVLLCSCKSNSNGNTENNSSKDSSVAQTPATKKDNYFVMLKGTVGAYPITMFLYARKQDYSGYYYYDSKEQPIYFRGDDTTAKGKTTLVVYGQDSSETFVLNFNGTTADGSWSFSSKTLPVKLSEANMPVKFSYHYWEDSVKLIDTLASSPQASAMMSTIWPEGFSAIDEFIKTQITERLLSKTKSRNIDSVFHQSGKAFFDDYKSGNELTKDDLKEMNESPSRFSYEMQDDIYICYQNKKMIVLAYSAYSYTGGAHGNYGTTYIPLNLVNNQVITLSQILTPEGMKHIRSLLETSYRKSNQLTPSQPLTDGGLFDNKIEPNENFYATGKQLVFSFVPYEISSYAAGQIDIAINLNDIQNYLQPSFKSLLQ